MPKKKNLDLAAELGEEVDVTEEQANDANTIVPVAPPPAPAAPISMGVADIQSIVQAAVAAAQGGNKEIADQITQGIAQARKPIPEGTDASNPRVSVYNPLGDRDHPRPVLKCEITLGTREGKDKPIQRTYPFMDDDLTVNEVIALNTLEPGNHKIDIHGLGPIALAIVPEYDSASDELKRLVIVVPPHVTQKGSQVKNNLPGPLQLVEQITGIHYGKLSADDLAWFMAEHRKKNYVAKREAVAA